MKIEVRNIPITKGVFATKDIERKYIIGRVYGKEEEGLNSEIAIDLQNGNSLEPLHPFKELNHSCNPNAELININNCIFVKARKKIKKNEQITINYGWKSKVKCVCGSNKCRGFI